MKNVLHILSALDVGGVEKTIKTIYDNVEASGYHFDFIVFESNIGILEAYFVNKKSKIYHICPQRKNLLKYISNMISVFREANYDIVHCHQAEKGWIVYIIAKIFKCKCIFHSHGCWHNISKIASIKKNTFLKISSLFVDKYCSCSTASAQYILGKNYKKSVILKNAFDTRQFLFSQQSRDRIRKLYSISSETILLGMVGRLSPEKNIQFALQIVQKMQKNIALLIVGDGGQRKFLEEECRRLGISDSVIFTGGIASTTEYYSAFDIFLFPSIHEGFGMALVEAQISGLPAIISNNITKEAIVLSENVFVKGLDKVDDWVSQINTFMDSHIVREVDLSRFDEFSVQNISNSFIQLYDTL